MFPALIPLISGIGGLFGALGKGKAAGREAEAAMSPQLQQQALQAALFNRQAPQMRLGAAARGDMFANAQPAKLSGSGRDLRMQGGLSPALLSPQSRQLGQQVTRQALMSQMKPGTGGDPYSFDAKRFAPPQSGVMDKILGIGGIAGAVAPFAGGIWDLLKPKRDVVSNSGFTPKGPIF